MKKSVVEAVTFAVEGPIKEAYLLLAAAVEAAGGEAAAYEAVCAKPGVVVAVDEEAVRGAETATGLSFGGALRPLLLMYSGLSVLDRFNFDFEHLASYVEEAGEEGLPEALVPLGRRRRFWICVERGAKAAAVIDIKEGTTNPGELTRTPLAAWLEEVRLEYEHGLVEVHARSEPSREQRRGLDAWARRATLEVVLRPPERKGPSSLYRVRHSKFGEGLVRREEPSGADLKLEIDFGSAGVKMMLARFVERIAER